MTIILFLNPSLLSSILFSVGKEGKFSELLQIKVSVADWGEEQYSTASYIYVVGV
jgi:hypothetical protein